MELEPTDSPSSVSATGPAPAGRFARWASATALSRLGLAAVLAVGALGLLSYGGSRAVRSLAEWLHRRPEYQLPFRQIELEPAPPAWIRSRRLGLLERVRERARWPEPLPVPDLDLEDLRRDFRDHSPWVARVRQIQWKHPNRLVVRLDYREPVAEIRFGPISYVLDGDAVVLPADDLVRGAAGPLVPLHGLDPPDDGRPGLYWGYPGEPDPDAVASARLAAFLKARTHLEEPGRPPIRPLSIRHRDLDGALCILDVRKTWVCWGEAPGAEAPDRPTASQKWAMLRIWARDHCPAEVVDPDFLDFDREGVVVREGRARAP